MFGRATRHDSTETGGSLKPKLTETEAHDNMEGSPRETQRIIDRDQRLSLGGPPLISSIVYTCDLWIVMANEASLYLRAASSIESSSREIHRKTKTTRCFHVGVSGRLAGWIGRIGLDGTTRLLIQNLTVGICGFLNDRHCNDAFVLIYHSIIYFFFL